MPVFTGAGSIVTSSNIVDGTIVNADISANANIAISKLNNAPFKILADVTLGTAGLTLDTGTFDAKNLLRVSIHIPGVAGATGILMRFNNDTGSNYNYQNGPNLVVSGPAVAQTSLSLSSSSSAADRTHFFDLFNRDGFEKGMVRYGKISSDMTHGVGIYTVTSGQITRIQIITTANMNVGSRIIVMGND